MDQRAAKRLDRAAVALDEDFRSGLDDWASRR